MGRVRKAAPQLGNLVYILRSQSNARCGYKGSWSERPVNTLPLVRCSDGSGHREGVRLRGIGRWYARHRMSNGCDAEGSRFTC
jgi:hypothetical protein